AVNLSSDQLDSLATDAKVKIVSTPSLDFVYMTLTNSADMNQALGKKAARQAVPAAIDYDGSIKGLMGGHAIRPATFIPIGLGGPDEGDRPEAGPGQGQEAPRRRGPAERLLVQALVRQGRDRRHDVRPDRPEGPVRPGAGRDHRRARPDGPGHAPDRVQGGQD